MIQGIVLTARAIAVAGLLPQFAAVLLVATGLDPVLGTLAAFAYTVLISSFIGGIWWGFAMQSAERQAGDVVAAVLPTLVGFALIVARVLGMPAGWALVAAGSFVMLTLLIDRRFADRGVAPPGWMGVRVPLSLGLGALTILAGMLAPAGVAISYSS